MNRNTTTRVQRDGERVRLFLRKYALQVRDGVDRGLALTTSQRVTTVGSAPQNDLVLTDPSVSRHHLRVEVTPRGFQLTDLDSTNGTTAGALELGQLLAHGPVELRLGRTGLTFTPLQEEEEVRLPTADRFGNMLGGSPVMRELFERLELVAPKDVTVLLEGETGTGKELIAEQLHAHSPRRDGPFVVLDCGAIPASLIESELFGHARGTFTGATHDRPGAFEEADGGTLFVDEIGELDLALQPRLLRALEQRQVKRLGENRAREVDIRVICATNRDLQRMVNSGAFRADLYYRLAVVHLRVPPLRDRPEDIIPLVEHLLPAAAVRLGRATPPRLERATLQHLVSQPWPGNVRELRNFLERLVLLSRSGQPVPRAAQEPAEEPDLARLNLEQLVQLPFREAKSRLTAAFDRAYVTRLLQQCHGNVAEAARRSGVTRVHLFRLIRKYDLREATSAERD